MRVWRIVALLSLVALCSAVLAVTAVDKKTASEKAKRSKTGIYHVVVFKFKDSVSQQQINKVCRDFRSLRKKVPEILSYKAGVNNSPEGLNKGFTHCFILTFKDAKARDTYLPHPAHKAFGASLKDLIADVFVVDFEA